MRQTILWLALALCCQAETVFTNYTFANLPGGGEAVRGNAGLGAAFTPATNAQFYSVTIPLMVDTANQPCPVIGQEPTAITDCSFQGETATVAVSLRSGSPSGTMLDNLREEQMIGLTPADTTFDCILCPTLLAGNQYWFALFNNDPAPFISEDWLSVNNAGTWAENFYGTSWVELTGNSSLAFSVNGGGVQRSTTLLHTASRLFASVPEPDSGYQLASFLLLIAILLFVAKAK